MPRRGGASRMVKQWLSIPGSAINATASPTSAVFGSVDFEEPATIMRMIGEYTIFPTSAPVAGDEVLVHIAVGVLSDASVDAATAGFAADQPFPDGDFESDFPWLYWASHPLAYNGVETVTGLASWSVRRSFDVRSRRRVKPAERLTLVGAYANVGSGGSPPLTVVTGATRVLVAT